MCFVDDDKLVMGQEGSPSPGSVQNIGKKIVVIGDLKINSGIIDFPKMFKISAPVSMGAGIGTFAPGNADSALYMRSQGVSPGQIKGRTRPDVGRKERPCPLIGVVIIPLQPLLTDEMFLAFADHGS